MDSEASLCDFCKTINFRDVGFTRLFLPDPVYDTGSDSGDDIRFEDRFTLDKVLQNSKQCIFCGEIAELFRQWTLQKFGKYTRDLENDLLEKAVGVLVSMNRCKSIEVDDEGEPKGYLNRLFVRLSFYKPPPERGVCGPDFQFQKCSQRPPRVSELCSDDSLFDWGNGEEDVYSGRIRPLVADCRLFRKWKESCYDIHGDECNLIFAGIQLPRLRLIDVEKRCVVDSENGSSYTALSYVWGKVTLPQLTQSTEKLFREPGSLNPETVPSVIDDAIVVTTALGEKYIWIDCLCIMQDDEADKVMFISKMDLIFGFASVTIVAASGVDAEAGLPGINPKSRTCEQRPFTINGVSLLATLDPGGSEDQVSYLGESVWCSRAWTFQERLFSGRALIFTPEQVYWECQKASWCEDSLWETRTFPIIYRHSLADEEFCHPWEIDDDSFERVYRKLVEEYSMRMLTFGSDGLRAFAGVLQHFLRLEADQWFFWGLPGHFLSAALTFACDRSAKRRLDCNSEKSPDGAITLCPFPSWCWVGWVGQVYYVQLFGNLNSETIDLIFYYLDKTGLLERIDSAAATQSLSELHVRKIDDKTIVTREDIPDSVFARSIASNTLWFSSSGAVFQFRHEVLCFWSSAAILHVRHGKDSDGFSISSFSCNDKIVRFRTPILIPGPKELAEFVVIGKQTTNENRLALLLVEWEDGVAYRRGVAGVEISDWVDLNNRVWKLIILG